MWYGYPYSHNQGNVVTDSSDEHIPWVRFWCVVHFLNELSDGTSHEVWFIDFMFSAYGVHVFFKCLGHTQACLVRVFLHRQFLSSFWILVTIRLTISSIRSSLGLLVSGIFFRPHRGLVSGFDWLFFIGFTPVQQSSQEYLGVLVHDPVRWIQEIS